MVRKFVTEDLSLENMIGSLFDGKSKGAYAIESEELSDGGELTSDEIDVLEDDDADPAYLSEESLRHFANANSLSIGLQAAETYLWKKTSKENDDGIVVVEKLKNVELDDSTTLSEEQKRSNESDDNIWKKFWNWLKGIFSSIRIGIITFFKRVQIWLASDMKKYGEWYNENISHINDIKKSEVTLKVRPLNINYDKFYSEVKTSLDRAGKFSEKLATELKQNFWEKLTRQGIKVDTKNIVDEDIIKKVSPEQLRETLYGEKSVQELSAAEFFKNFNIDNLKNAVDVKTYLKDSQEVINQASVGIKTSEKVIDGITDEDARKAVKAYATGLEKSISKTGTGLIWLTSTHIQLLNISLRYCKAAIKDLPAPSEDKTEKTKTEKKK